MVAASLKTVMPSIPAIPALAQEPDEQRLLLHNVSWKEYGALRELLDQRYLRMTYLEGKLELMTISSRHELWKDTIARLVELYAYLRRIHLVGYGSTTFKLDMKQRGAEPDKCYVIGGPLRDFPDIVLEVIVTAPLLDKLKVYAGFGVAEVWVFKDGTFSLFQLDREAGNYVAVDRSRLLPGIDFSMIARYASRTDQEALYEFTAELQKLA